MISTNKVVKSKKNIREIAMFGFFLILVLLFLIKSIWTISGSNQWKLVKDKNGIKIYTIKTPGSPLLRVKSVNQVHASLSGLVKLIEAPESCDDVGCFDSKRIEDINSQTAYCTFKFKMPPPFKAREYVNILQHSQNPENKKIEIHIIAAPNKINRNDKCIRIEHMHNIWNLTPLNNGIVEIEYLQDINLGGAMPFFLTNLILPEVGYKVLDGLQGLMDKEKYKAAKLDYVID